MTIPVIQDVVITGNLLICNGESSTLTVEGNYSTYDWSNGQTGNPITVNQAGVYTVTVTDAGDCTGTGSVTVVESTNSVTIDGPSLLCGGSSGVLNSVPDNWQSYLWSTGESTPSITVSDAGTYALTVTDDLGCTSTNTLNLAAEPLPTVQFTVANPDVCSGECMDIQANFTGTAPFQLTYTAFNLSFSETFSTNSGTIEVCVPPGNPPGPTSINAVSITDAWCTCDQGCQGLGSIAINVEDLPVPEIDGELAICDGQTTTYTVNGGPFSSYEWSTGATTSSIIVNTAATYTVTVTNAAGCTGTDSQTLQVTSPPLASFSLQGSTVCGASITLTGANGFTAYAWSTGETTQAITFFTSGTYTLTVTDANGCTDDVSTTLIFESTINVTINGNTTFCEGGATTLSANPSGLVSYSWSDGQSDQSIVVSSPGIYNVTATDNNGCSGSATVSITELPNPVPLISGPSVICEFQNANLNVGGGFSSYIWSNGETTDFINTSNPGTYTVTVTSSDGCTASTSFSLTVLPAPTPQITSSGAPCDGQVVLDAGSGYVNYSWSNFQSGNPITVNLTDNYAVTVTDNNGCTNNAAFFVFINPGPMVSITGVEQFCESESTTLEASPGFETYLWSNGQSGASITVNSPGVYSVTATDNFGCSDSEEITITVLPEPNASISGPGTICENQQAVWTASSGFNNYTWSNGENGANITVSNAGTYTVTITDNNGCTASATEILNVLSIPQPNITTAPYQCDGQIILDAGGGFSTYLWSNGQDSNPVTVNLSGNYSVVVTAANGCTNTDILFVDIPPMPLVSINGNSQICAGEITNLQATAGFNTYLWSTGQGGQSIDVSNSGNFSVTVTDNFGCTASATLAVSDLPAPTPVISGPLNTCSGQAVTLETQGGFNSYLWSTGESTPTILVNSAGTYSVTVTASNGCTGIDNQDLTVLPAPQPSINALPYNCDAQLSLNAGGNFNTYLWSTGETTQDIVIPQSGLYAVTVTLTNGCTGSDVFSADIPSLPSVQISGNATFCQGSSSVLVASAGFNQYIWSTGEVTQSITINQTGNYAVTVTDAFGCTDESIFSVQMLNNPTPAITGPTTICVGGQANFNVPGNFNDYIWSSGQNTQSITVLDPGVYTVTVTAANGCTGVDEQTLTVSNSLEPVIAELPYNCNGQIDLDAGAGYLTYTWSSGENTPMLSVNTSGDYSVTVTDATGCVGTDVISVLIPSNPVVVISGASIICQNNNTLLEATPGFQSYLWSNNQVGPSITVGTAGDFSVIATDNFGCTATSSFTVSVSPLPEATINGPGTLCLNSNGILSALTGFSGYIWSTGETSNSISVNSAGIYTVTITDANSCTNTGSASLVVTDLFEPQIINQPYACNGQITIETDAGFATYLWNSGQITPNISVTQSGTYSVTVSDNNGCTGVNQINVQIPTIPSLNIDGITTFCAGDSTTLNATPGFVSYVWSTGESTSSILTGLNGGIAVLATDSLGCAVADTTQLSALALPVPQILGPTRICAGDSTFLSISGSFPQISWSTGAATNQIQVNAANTYQVTVTDAAGCSGTASSDLLVNPNPSPQIIAAPYACDGQITLSVDANYTSYLWNTGQTLFQINSAQSGSYTVMVTDTNGCSGVAALVVDVPTITQVTVGGFTQFCPGGSSTISASSGFASYLWTDGSTDSTLEVSQPGLYTVTATDALGCSSEAQISISTFLAPQPQISGPLTVCTGNTADLTASSGFVAYQWSTGDVSSTITVLPPTTVNLTVTDTNGCTGTTEINIGVSNQLTPQIQIIQEACAQSALLDVGAGYPVIQWSNGATTQQITSTQPGQYSVTVSNAAGCSGEAITSINFPVLPALEISGNTQLCPGGTGSLQAVGVFDQYLWSTGANTNNISINVPGNYTLTVTDAAGCTTASSILVETQPAPIPVISNPGVLCGDAALLSSSAGFTSYAWSNGQTNAQISVSQPGNYSLTVTDVNGCTGIASASLTSGSRDSTFIQVLSCDPQNVGITVESFTGSDGCDSVVVIQTGLGGTLMSSVTIDNDTNGYGLSCAGDSNGIATVVPQGGQTPFQYLWSNGANTATISDLKAGLYTVTVTDLNGCIGTTTALLEGPEPVVPILQTINPTCFLPGIITIQQIDGGISPYSVQINPEVATTDGTTPLQFGNLSDGLFSVEITDANGCLSEEIVVLTQPNAVNEIVGDTLDILPGETVTLNAPITIAPLEIAWTGSSSPLSCDNCLNPSLSPLSTTELQLKVQGYGGCSAEGLFLIRVKSEGEVYIPNIFAPNSADLNNRFTVFGDERVINIRSLQLYDRWGNLMVVLQDIPPNTPEQGWDGRFNGEPMGPGVYVYWTEVEFSDGSTAIFKGDVTLIR